MRLRETILITLLWLALVLLSCVTALQGAVAVLTFWNEPALAFATDPCGEDIVIISGIFLMPVAIVSAAAAIGVSLALKRTHMRRAVFVLASGYALAIVAPLLVTVGPRFGNDWAPVRAAWAQCIDDETIRGWRRWGPAMPIWIGERRATVRLLERNKVRLDLGNGANMDVHIPTMFCTYSD